MPGGGGGGGGGGGSGAYGRDSSSSSESGSGSGIFNGNDDIRRLSKVSCTAVVCSVVCATEWQSDVHVHVPR